MIGPLIHWAIMHVRYDRRIARRARLLSTCTTYRAKMTRHLMDGRGRLRARRKFSGINGFFDWAPEWRTDDPAELAAALEQAGLSLDEYLAA